MNNITPFLWFNDNAEDAMRFYVAVFPDSKVLEVTRYGDAGLGPKGSVMTRDVRGRGAAIHRFEGRPAIQIHGSGLFSRPVREPGGGRQVLRSALRGR